MTKNRFIGTWRLVSCEVRSADGRVSYPYGQDAVGYIMYSKAGYMSVAMMNANRPKFASDDLKEATAEEIRKAGSTYLSYCGRYEIQGDKVIHHIEASSFPNWIGVDLERDFEFHGDRLTLIAPLF
jgi:hypothetical protein